MGRCKQSISDALRDKLSWVLALVWVVWVGLSAKAQEAGTLFIGDLDGDGRATVVDLVQMNLLYEELRQNPSLAAEEGPRATALFLADVDGDGLLTESDFNAELSLILNGATLNGIGPTRIRTASPANGETGVALTRETIIELTYPLSKTSQISRLDIFAEFAGRRLLATPHLSNDRRIITLVYQENLPGSARIRVTLAARGAKDFVSRAVDLDGDGDPNNPVTIDFDTVSITPVPETGVVGRVFRSDPAAGELNSTNLVEEPLEGVTIEVIGAEQDQRVLTDSQGNFRIEPCPSGKFYVRIDGRTAKGSQWPAGGYFPVVEKAWEAVPGKRDNKAGGVGDIYLPWVPAGTLQTTTATNATVVTFTDGITNKNPELSGVEITVPANALFTKDGTRGGKIGIVPVSPTRLPEALPAGLNHVVDISIQVDGNQNFDQRLEAKFPNLPDPVTGQRLPPGAKTALWSYNHDLGRWEVVGSMTVTEDGNFVVSDPGQGIKQPGWHGTNPGNGDGDGPDGDGDGDGDDGDGPGPCPPGTCCPPPPPPGGSNPVLAETGEKVETVVDLEIKGVGLNFTWQRTYRSRARMTTTLGNSWEFNYNLFLERSGLGINVCDGHGRKHLFTPRAAHPGTYGRHGHAIDVQTVSSNEYQIVHPDNRLLKYLPFDGGPAQGKIAEMSDRHGNRLRFFYDSLGRLERINDTLERDVRIRYNNEGFISSLTDFAGRTVRYEYYRNGDEGGSFGDLKAVTYPVVRNTPTGNDFPDGARISYTYSRGFSDPRLNHNLLTIVDRRRNDPKDPLFGKPPHVVNIYSGAVDPKDPSFDRVVRQILGGDNIDFHYVQLNPETEFGKATRKTIVRDREGNVVEYWYDAQHLNVKRREYTGRSRIDEVVTETSNRPVNKLRESDPDFFETRFEYNRDRQLTRVIHPNGNLTEKVYLGDLQPQIDPRLRGNLMKIRRLPGQHQPAGDQTVIEESFEYAENLGGCCGSSFITKHVDGNGNAELRQYDAVGNLTNLIHRIPSITEQFAYDSRGRRIRHVHPDNGSGHRRVDEMRYYEDGPMKGYLKEEVIDAGGLNITSSLEYDLVGNVRKKVDPRGNDTQFIYNSWDLLIREISPEVQTGTGVRYVKEFHYDTHHNLIRKEVQNRRALLLVNGAPFRSDISRQLGIPAADGGIDAENPQWSTLFEYDDLNNLTRKREEVEKDRFIVTEYGYDRNRKRTLTRFGEATAGRQPDNVVLVRYDERLQPFQEVRGAGGTNAFTTQFDYDGNLNTVRVSHGLEDHPHTTTYTNDGFDRQVQKIDAMGNIYSSAFDANGNQMRSLVLGELHDLPGSAGNVRLSETLLGYDRLNRLTNHSVAFFNATNQEPILDGWATTTTIYTDSSQVFAVINDNGHGRTNSYDSALRLRRTLDAKGNTVHHEMDASGNVVQVLEVEKSDLAGMPPTPFPGTGPNGSVVPYVPQPAQLGQDESFVNTSAFDNLNRLVISTDGAGNVNRSGYDSRGNRTLTVDALTNVIHVAFDGVNRELDTTREMENHAPVAPLKSSLITRQVWDDSSRLVQQIDDNTNATTYVYDGQNRKFATVYADLTGQTNLLDAHGNAILFVDANGSFVTNRYDDLDRLIRRDVKVGPGVSDDTTWEEYHHDGLGRLAYAADDDSVVVRSYDSLGRVRRDVQGTNVVGSVYDAVGNQTELHYPSGRVLVTTYDELERKKRISEGAGVNAGSLIAEYWYAGPNRVTRRDYGNGTISLWQYDGLQNLPNATGDHGFKRIIRTTHHGIEDRTVLDDRSYGWGRLMNKIQSKDVRVGGHQISHDYLYDSAYRLVQSIKSSLDGPSQTVTYYLDGVGNRLKVVDGGDSGNYVMDATMPEPSDRQMNQYTRTPFDSRTNDLNGNLTHSFADGLVTSRQQYDFHNRLTSFTNVANSKFGTFRYDVLGRRFLKTVGPIGSDSTEYFYNDWQNVEEKSEFGSALDYVHGSFVDDAVGIIGPHGVLFYFSDELYNVVAVSDGSGAVKERYDYGDYGMPLFYSEAGQAKAQPDVQSAALFNGRRYDPESGLLDYRTRFYSAQVGRFLTPDSIGTWGDKLNLGNAYTYVGNRPSTLLDPYGELGWLETVDRPCSYTGFCERVVCGMRTFYTCPKPGTQSCKRMCPWKGPCSAEWQCGPCSGSISI